MTIISILDVRVRPDALETAATILHDTLEQTRSRPGCLGVEVGIDVDDPAHFIAVEKWDSIDSDDAYRAWRATPEGASNLRTIVAAAPVLTRTVLHDEI